MPETVLQWQPFGRTKKKVLWVEGRFLLEISRVLRDDPEHCLDWLENLSVMDVEGALVLTYFLRSTQTQSSFLLRVSLAPMKPEDSVETFSIASIWPMGRRMELEASELFGIQFIGNHRETALILSEDPKGFPQRKGYRR